MRLYTVPDTTLKMTNEGHRKAYKYFRLMLRCIQFNVAPVSELLLLKSTITLRVGFLEPDPI